MLYSWEVIFLKMDSKQLFITFTYVITYILYLLISDKLHRECDAFATFLMATYLKQQSEVVSRINAFSMSQKHCMTALENCEGLSVEAKNCDSK